MRHSHIFPTTLVLALFASGCAHDSRPIGAAADALTGPAPYEQATVEVTNSNWSDINVYAVRGGMRYRLGTVTSMTSRVFELPRALTVGISNLRLHADPIGARRGYTSPAIMLGVGHRVIWRIENNLTLSNYAVRD